VVEPTIDPVHAPTAGRETVDRGPTVRHLLFTSHPYGPPVPDATELDRLLDEVLYRLARTGRPSRSEITDAAMSDRAECLMLNKGPHIVEAITVLDDILRLRSWTGVA
jgi:hypothetical protein